MMIIGQTMFSVSRGTEHHAEAVVDDIARLLVCSVGLRDFRILRSVGMSPLASDLGSDGREAPLCDSHYIIQTEWDRIEDHDAFYADEKVRHIYVSLAPILATGPYEILYEALAEERAREGVVV